MVSAAFPVRGHRRATIQFNDWAWLREFSRGDGDLKRDIVDLSRPGALTASLNWYRANLAPRMPGSPRQLPPMTAPALASGRPVITISTVSGWRSPARASNGPWRHEVIPGASHWIPLDAPDRLNELLLGWLR